MPALVQMRSSNGHWQVETPGGHYELEDKGGAFNFVSPAVCRDNEEGKAGFGTAP